MTSFIDNIYHVPSSSFNARRKKEIEDLIQIPIIERCTHFEIPEKEFVLAGLTEFIRDNLTEESKKFINRYAYYDKEASVYRFPRYFISHVKRIAMHRHNELVLDLQKEIIKLDNLPKIELSMKKGYKPRDYQIPHVNFLTRDSTMSLLDLQTGKGKTYCAIESISRLSVRTLIVCPSNLLNMWLERINEYTDLDISKDIYVISGSSSILRLHDYNFKDIDNLPKIFVASIKTLTSYLQRYHTVDAYQDTMSGFELFKKIQFGVKVIDEIHMNFHANCIIDLNTNIPRNLYLSATPSRSSYKGKRIFDIVYPKWIRSNLAIMSKYIVAVECGYKMEGVTLPWKYFQINDIGYSNVRYEGYICRRPWMANKIINDAIILMIRRFYLPAMDGKLLIFASTQKFVLMIKKRLEESKEFTEYRIIEFLGGYDDKLLTENDIIITTPGSMGTGKDVSDIKTIINTISFRSPILLKQMTGRMRETKEYDQVIVHLYNRDSTSHISHSKQRIGVSKKFCKKVERIKINI